jgi:hypothetical protein
MYLSHFGHGLLEMILQLLREFHVSQGNFTDIEPVHRSQGTGHITQDTLGLFSLT